MVHYYIYVVISECIDPRQAGSCSSGPECGEPPDISGSPPRKFKNPQFCPLLVGLREKNKSTKFNENCNKSTSKKTKWVCHFSNEFVYSQPKTTCRRITGQQTTLPPVPACTATSRPFDASNRLSHSLQRSNKANALKR
jgi:hypothetical protein